MSSDKLAELTQAQRDRLAFIELRSRFLGEIRRQDIVSRFGVQEAAATRDIAQYKELAPRNLEYDTKSKIYRRATWFSPLFEPSVERVLTWISQGFGDSEPLRFRPFLICENPGRLSRVDLDVLATLTQAIFHQRPVEIGYRSLSSGLTSREIVPVALAENGLRWHVRAFDRRTKEFRDFVLGRIADAKFAAGEPAEHESPSQDIQWNRIAELALVPHPANVQHPDTIEAEYGMTSGVLRIQVRAALAAYLLRHMNVDCTADHSMRGPEFHLWLRNRQALYGVTNLVLAPGYGAEEEA